MLGRAPSAGKPLKVLACFLLYAALALLFIWPLPLHFTTHYLGVRGDDTGVIIWDMWYFRHAITVLKTNPLWTDLVYWPFGGDLILTNYTLFNDAVAFFLAPAIGMAATWNSLFVASAALSGLAVLGLLLDWGYAWGPAFVSGALFAFCPTVAWQTRCGRGLEFACVDAIPFFFWALSRALRDGKLRDAALAALCLTWVWTCNYYYFLICALLIPLAYVSLRRPVSLGLERRPARGLALKALDAALLAALAWAVHAAFWTGQRAFHGRGSARTLLMYLLPYLCLWGLAALRLAAAYSARWRFNREAARWPALKPYAATLGLWLALNLPMVVAVLYLMSTGDYATAPRAWRGGGDPVDPLWLAIPSLYHPFWSGWILRWIKRLPFGKPIWTSLGLTPLAAAAWLWPRRPRGEQWVGLWFAGASVCSVLVLGPWLRLFGVDTYLPLPFYFLHLLPVLNNMANGTNFAIFAALFLALLFAVALTEMMRRLTPRRARWVPAAAFALVALEFAPGRLPNFRLDVPPLIRRFAGRPRGAFLPVPLAEHFPRLMYGMAGTEWLEMTTQMVDARPRVGGFLPRVSERVYRQAMGDPFFKALLAAQGGAAPAGALTDSRRVSRYFRDMKIRYVLVQRALVSAALERAIQRWPISEIDRDGTLSLYAVREP